jgi:hypothetical protein
MNRKSKCFPKRKPQKAIDWILKASDRASQRKTLAHKWLREKQYRSYRYFVETCDDGKRVYLRRPTFLNKGFDFQVNVEGFRSQTRRAKGVTKEMPSHPDVFRDLRRKIKSHPKLKRKLFLALCDVYDCVEPDKILRKHPSLRRMHKGLPIDKLLRIIKWLFIEQDLTYWLGTGRNMLMSAIERKIFKMEAELYS